MGHVLGFEIAKDGLKFKMATKIKSLKCIKWHISGSTQCRDIIEGSKCTFQGSENSDLLCVKDMWQPF